MTNQANDSAANDIDGDEETAAQASRLKNAADAVRDAAAATKTAAADAISAARDKVGEVIDTAKEKSEAVYTSARDRTTEVYGSARERTTEAYVAAREKAADAYDTARDKAAGAYDTARDKASQARRATADGIDDNPVAALLGGIALGVLVGALLPRTKTEADALGPIANKLADTAKAAAFAARDAGRQTLDELGVNSDNARGQVEKLVDTAVRTVASAGTAAAETVRNP